MTILSRCRQSALDWMLPCARAYIRFSPFAHGKQFLWRWFSWRQRLYTVRTVDGIRMHGRSTDVVQGYIYYFGVWEPNLTEFLRNQLQDPARVFVDVGANVGYFSLLASKLLSSGRVISIEPYPSTYQALAHNIS